MFRCYVAKIYILHITSHSYDKVIFIVINLILCICVCRSNDVRKVRCVGCDLHAALWKEDVVGCDTQNIASRLHIL